MNLKESVFEQIGKYPTEGVTLVFPYENVARSYATAYVRETKKALFPDALISWDTFRDNFTAVPEGFESAVFTDRCLFVSQWFENGGFQKLRYYADSQFSCAKGAYIKSIASSLPDMCKAFDLSTMEILGRVKEIAPSDMIHDLMLLVPAYKKFLEDHSMYEKSLLEPDFSKAQNYMIVLPQCITDSLVEQACLFAHVLSYDNPVNEGNRNDFKIASNSLSEIRECLRSIYDQLKEGEPLSDFAITCGELDSYRPYLEREARRRDIELRFLSSKRLSDYAPGQFFIALKHLKDSNYSLGAMKNLILDPKFPFQDRETMAQIIAQAIEMKIQEGSLELWKTKLSKCKDKNVYEVFNSLSDAIIAIVNCTDPEKLRENVMVFIKTFFGEQSWTDMHSSQEAKVFGSCEKELNTLYIHAKAFGIEQKGDLFDLFVDIICDKRYQPNDKGVGIAVYKYPMSAGLAVKNHYVIGLGEANTRNERNPYPFIKDDCPDSVQLGDGVLDLYQYGIGYGGSVMSGCDENFSGAVILPTRFLSDNRVVRVSKPKNDSLRTEEDVWKCNVQPDSDICWTRAQKNSEENAMQTSLMFSSENVFPEVSTPFEMSISREKDFEECPYKGYAKSILRMKEYDFQPRMDDPGEVGEILHVTFQKALAEAKRLENIREDRLKEIFRKAVAAYESKANSTDKNHVARIIRRYEDSLYDIVEGASSSYLKGLDFAGKEETTSASVCMYQIRFKGRADCVLVNDSGDFAVIDFKKNGDNYYKATDLSQTSLQLAIYARMIEANEKYGRIPVRGAYYSVEDGKFLYVWPFTEVSSRSKQGYPYDVIAEDCDKRVKAVSDMIENSSFDPTPSEESCKFCKFGILCRGGFEVR